MDFAKLTDYSLLAHFKKNAPHTPAPSTDAAFDEVLRRYERLIFHIARTYLYNYEDAKDATQDIAIKIYNNLLRVVIPEDGSLKPWIVTVTARTCLDILRKKKLQTVNLEIDIAGSAEFSAEDKVIAKEKAQETLRAIKNLPDNHRMILILRDMKGLSYEDLSEALGLNMGTVKSQLSRARAAVREQLKARGY